MKLKSERRGNRMKEGKKKSPPFFFPWQLKMGSLPRLHTASTEIICFLRCRLIKSDMVSELCFFLVWAPQKETVSSRSSSGG